MSMLLCTIYSKFAVSNSQFTSGTKHINHKCDIEIISKILNQLQ